MARRIVLAVACSMLFALSSNTARNPHAFPITEAQRAKVLTGLEWTIFLCLVLEVNAALNRLAENNWRLTNDKRAWNFSQELAVVTGGSNGIGAKVVQELVARGVRVAVLDIEPLSEDFRNVSNKLDGISHYHCDITSREAIHRAGNSIRSDLGDPSILINNAGVGAGMNILDLPAEKLASTFNVNILSHWYTVQEFLPSMLTARKGHIMSTASLASFAGLAGSVEYSATKAGLMAFHEGLTSELKHRYKCPEIKTTIVYPNWTRTRLIGPISNSLRNMGAPIVAPEDIAKAMVMRIIDVRSGQLIFSPAIAAWIRAMPIWLQELIRDRTAKAVILA